MVFGVVAQQGNDRARALADELATHLAADDIEVWVDAVTAESLGREGTAVEQMAEAELVASIGGDGTFLFTAQWLDETPIVGVNLGEVGFLTAVAPEDASSVVAGIYGDLVADDLTTTKLPRVAATGTDWALGPALNEITVHAPRRGPSAHLSLDISVDGDRFTRDRADGVILATPTGSTAYNLSEGGPLVAPDVPAIAITEMCGREPMPPLVVPLDSTVTVDLAGTTDALVIADGRNRQEVSVPARVTIDRAESPLRVAGPPVAFFETLDKLV